MQICNWYRWQPRTQIRYRVILQLFLFHARSVDALCSKTKFYETRFVAVWLCPLKVQEAKATSTAVISQMSQILYLWLLYFITARKRDAVTHVGVTRRFPRVVHFRHCDDVNATHSSGGQTDIQPDIEPDGCKSHGNSTDQETTTKIRWFHFAQNVPHLLFLLSPVIYNNKKTDQFSDVYVDRIALPDLPLTYGLSWA